MGKIAQLPTYDRTPGTADAEVRSIPRPQTRYYAFLSYSHKDKELADWLHRQLERFRVPRALAGRLTANGVVPKRLTPIFRDEHDLAAAGDLGGEIKATLAVSQFLIVLCSPTAAQSRWTNAEVEWFKQTHPDGCALAAIASGEPFASEMPGREAEECFPPALRHKYDRRGRPTAKRAEPLAADLRGSEEAKRVGFLKLVAGMLGVGLDELVQREQTRRHRRLAWLAAASLAGMTVTSTLSLIALQSRNEAREQRREAEGLVGFMLGDLKDKLEPIGKLDVLDEVGPKVLEYYQHEDAKELSDQALAQRSKALTLMGQIADARGNKGRALALYREAYAGTAEALRRNPQDPQRLFNHAQNVFYLAESARLGGDMRDAESGMREYRRLAEQMVALDPNNLKWRMEQRFADMDLGIVYFDQRKFPEAAAQFSDGLKTIQAITAIGPTDRPTQEYLPEAMAWLADAEVSEGDLKDAIAMRQRNIAVLEQFLHQTNDVAYREKLVPAHRGLASLYAAVGKIDDAIKELSAAVEQAQFLTDYEPNNATWVEYESLARLNLAQILALARRTDEAANQAKAGCDAVGRLLAKDRTVPEWRAGLRDCLVTRAQIALARGSNDEAVQHAKQAVAIASSVHTSDAIKDKHELGKAYRALGDAYAATRDLAAAKNAWSSALASLPPGVAERPSEMDEHATILERLGRKNEANEITSKLTAMGYRRLS